MDKLKKLVRKALVKVFGVKFMKKSDVVILYEEEAKEDEVEKNEED